MDVMNNLLGRKIALLLLLLLIIEMLQILRKIVHVPIPFSPYVAVRFAAVAVAVAARRRYRAP